jgi:hypothetical protein
VGQPHEIKAEKSLPKGTMGVDDAPVLRWAELTASKATLRRITLRLEPADLPDCEEVGAVKCRWR